MAPQPQQPEARGAKNRNPIVGTDAGETVESVCNVLEFLTWHRLEGEDPTQIADGRRLVLECCSEALSTVIAW